MWGKSCFQFIGFPNEWGVKENGATYFLHRGFQFIGFPNEWGDASLFKIALAFVLVSNLLGSPTSGEGQVVLCLDELDKAFPIYWVPQRVGRLQPLYGDAGG